MRAIEEDPSNFAARIALWGRSFPARSQVRFHRFTKLFAPSQRQRVGLGAGSHAHAGSAAGRGVEERGPYRVKPYFMQANALSLANRAHVNDNISVFGRGLPSAFLLETIMAIANCMHPFCPSYQIKLFLLATIVTAYFIHV